MGRDMPSQFQDGTASPMLYDHARPKGVPFARKKRDRADLTPVGHQPTYLAMHSAYTRTNLHLHKVVLIGSCTFKLLMLTYREIAGYAASGQQRTTAPGRLSRTACRMGFLSSSGSKRMAVVLRQQHIHALRMSPSRESPC
jgi:hypothetical protein